MPHASPPKRPLSTTLLLVALWIVFYASFTLFHPALLDDADSVHAEVAREMLLRHDWVTLYANGIRYLEKAPLLYWSMATSMGVAQLLGHTSAKCLAVAARVPLALTVLALAFAVEAFARRAFRSPKAGLYAALILLSSPGIFLFTRILLPDAMLCLWLTLAMLAFWVTEQEITNGEQASTVFTRASASRTARSAFAACCALGVLTKGLIGVVFPLAIVAIYLLLTRGLRGTLNRILELHPFSSTAVFLAIAAPWHLLAAWANLGRGHPGDLTFANGHWQVPLPTDGNVHGWAWFYFVNEQVLRYLNLRVPRDYDTVPLWLFWGLLLIWLMPWSAFMFKAIANAMRVATKSIRMRQPQANIEERPDATVAHETSANGAPIYQPGAKPQENVEDKDPRAEGPTYLLLILWAALPLLFFSFSTRQEYYVLPSLPPIALLIAAWLAHQAPTKPRAQAHRDVAARCAGALAMIGVCVAIACVWLILHGQKPAPDTDLAALLQQNPADYALSMGHFLDLNARAMGLFRLPLALTAISFGAAFAIAFVLRRFTSFAFIPILIFVRIRKRRFDGGRIRNHIHAANLVTAAGAFGFLLAAHLGLQTFAPVLSSQQLAAAIAPQVQVDDLIVVHQEYEYGSTLGFYLRRPTYRFLAARLSPPQTTAPADNDHAEVALRPIAVNPIHILTDASYNGTANYGRSSNLWYGSFFPDAPHIFETPATLALKWRGAQRIFLWQDLAAQPSPLPAQLSPIYVVAKSGGKEIISNQPNQR